jgi:hypothetical protein
MVHVRRHATRIAFDHVGIITMTPQPGESWVESSQVFANHDHWFGQPNPAGFGHDPWSDA